MADKDLTSIIDEAMANDDADYGDNTPVDDNDGADAGDDGGSSSQQQDPNVNDAARQPPSQQQPDQQNVPGRVPQVPGAQQQELQRVGNQFADKKGNIVDKDGKLIATAGKEARFWQEASRATALARNLDVQLKQRDARISEMQKTFDTAKELAELPQKLGVSREDYNEGVTLMSRWRADPVGVAREVVARTLSFGHNVTDILGKDVGNSVDMLALKQLVSQATDPLIKGREQEAATAAANAEAEKAYNAFVSTHEFAETHADALAAQMGRGVPAEVAYLRLQNFALQNGLDFSQPLGPQIAARRNGNAQQPNGNGQRQPPSAPMLPGNGRGTQSQLRTQPDTHSADDDWSSIIRDAMGE